MDADVVNIDDKSKGGEEGERIKRSRPVKPVHRRSQDPGSQIRSLKCFVEVDKMVREGEYTRSIVHYIQYTRKELVDMSRQAVSYLVQSHRDYIYSDDSVLDGDVVQPREEDNPYHEIHVLRKLLDKLETRIDMETKTELDISKLFSTTHKEFMTAAFYCKLLIEKKKDLNLIDIERGSSRQRVGSGAPGRLDIPQIISNPESRQRILGLVEALVGDQDMLDDMGKGLIKELKEKPPRKKRIRRPNSSGPGKSNDR
jgi:hypothetical protein